MKKKRIKEMVRVIEEGREKKISFHSQSDKGNGNLLSSCLIVLADRDAHGM
jgi:hypothetical protein